MAAPVVWGHKIRVRFLGISFGISVVVCIFDCDSEGRGSIPRYQICLYSIVIITLPCHGSNSSLNLGAGVLRNR